MTQENDWDSLIEIVSVYSLKHGKFATINMLLVALHATCCNIGLSTETVINKTLETDPKNNHRNEQN